jgi:hypothetical protein
MTLYARSDLACISIPVTSGGCGTQHSRPVVKGAPAKVWALDCGPCESHLRGDGRQKKLVYETDRKTGKILRQQRVPDASPMWSSTPETVPLTPDEERTDEVRRERGRMQIEMLQALAALRSTGVEVPAEAMYLLEKELPSGVLRGTVVCVNQHDVPAGSRFCPECGASMATRAAVGGGDAEPAVDLGRLHVATLRKRCRDAGLPDKGSKDVLIGRLQAA